MVIITGGVMVVIMAIVATAVVMTPGKGSRKNPKKSSLTEKRGTPLKALNAKKSTSKGNKGTPRYLARLKKTIKRKIKGGLLIAQR